MIQEEKKQLRKQMKQKRNELETAYCEKADRQIMEKIITSEEYKKASMIFCYVSMEKEVDTFSILKTALRDRKGVCVPKCMEKGRMEAFQIRKMEDLQPGNFGALEPSVSCDYVSPEKIDFVLIPCLTCDREGNRLGYGGGYYDRYLKRSRFLKAVLCREDVLSEKVPSENTDCRMDVVVTEKGWMKV